MCTYLGWLELFMIAPLQMKIIIEKGYTTSQVDFVGLRSCQILHPTVEQQDRIHQLCGF